MLPRERVISVIRHQRPDRVPVYGWVRRNLEDSIVRTFGSVEAFEDKYEFDLAHVFGGPSPYPEKKLFAVRREKGDVEPADLLDIPMSDVNNTAAYDSLRKDIQFHKQDRGRFVYVQTPGIFECLNKPFGIENHLAYLLLFPEELKQVYGRQAEWNRQFALNCLDLGADMIHVSDDWGAQKDLMFSPETWRTMIVPYHRTVCKAVQSRNGFLSLHSDGNISAVADELPEQIGRAHV